MQITKIQNVFDYLNFENFRQKRISFWLRICLGFSA